MLKRVRRHCWDLAFAAAASYFLFLYALPPIRELQTFQLQNFDYGILYHSSWRLSAGLDSFMTVRGVHTWADNQEYLQWLLAPLHYLPGTSYLLLGLHSVAIWSCGVIAFFSLRGRGAAAPLAALFVWASPFLRNMSLDLIHVEALATPFLLLLYLACRRGGTLAAGLWLGLALACKEDVALSATALLLVVALLPREFALPRRLALAGAALAAAVLALNMLIVLPHYAAETCQRLDPRGVPPVVSAAQPVSPFFRDLSYKLLNPAFYRDRLLRPELAVYLGSLLWPALLALRGPRLLALLPLPAALANGLAEGGYFIEGYWHYDHSSFAMVAVAALHALARFGRPAAWAALLAGGSLVSGALAFPPPRVGLLDPLDARLWELRENVPVQAVAELARTLPRSAVTSADYTTISYMMDGRPELYMFRNPFEGEYFGIAGVCTELADPPLVELVVLRGDYPLDPDLAPLLESEFEEWVVSLLDGAFRFRVFVHPRGPRAEAIRVALHNFDLRLGTSYRLRGETGARIRERPPS